MNAVRALDAAELRVARAVCAGAVGLDVFGVEEGLPPAALVAVVAENSHRLAEVLAFPVAPRHRKR